MLGDISEFKGWLFLCIIFLVSVYGFIYTILGSDNFTSFGDSPVDGWYLALSTMSTVGHCDIAPKTLQAKLAIMSQQFLTLFVTTILILGSIKFD